MKTSIGVLFATLLVALGIATAAMSAPQGPWLAPASELSVPGQNADYPQIAIAPDGTAAAVWSRSDGVNTIIQAAIRPLGGSFGPPVDLSAAGRNSSEPQIAMAPDGTATAVWVRFDGSNIVQAATRPPGGSFGIPVDLSVPGQSAYGPQIVTAPDGTTTVVWFRSDGGNYIVQVATRPEGGSFGAPVDISVPGQNASSPQITTAADSVATVAWTRSDGSNFIIQAATRPPGGSFGIPVDLSAAGQDAFDPQIATARDGTIVSVWRRSDGANDIVQAAIRPPDGSFGTPVDLSSPGQSSLGPRVAVANDGSSTVVWYRSDGAKHVVQAATRPPGGSFGVPVNLSDAGEDASSPQIATAPDGTATAVWRGSDGANSIIQAATRSPGGQFGGSVDLSVAGQDAERPQVATALDGAATAIWVQYGDANGVVESISTARPSPLLRVNRTGTGRVTSTPAGIDCGTDCAENYPSFTKVTLTATPVAGSTFTGWSGACSGTGSCEVTMLEATSVTAAFGKPRLANLKITPKSKKVRRGKKATFKVRVKNTGDATARKLKLCVKGPKKQVKVPKCRKPGNLAAGRSKTVGFKVKVKNSAKKGRRAKLTFTAYAKGANKKSGKATVKIR